MSRAPPPSDQQRASGSGRRKVALPPGRSQLDWVRNSSRLRPPRPRSVSMRELAQHKGQHDAWMAIGGKVFDVTHYVEYHPGGVDMILAGSGKDGTKLFNKYHAWVNPDFMLARCYLGTLDADNDDQCSDDTESESEDRDVSTAPSQAASTTERKANGAGSNTLPQAQDAKNDLVEEEFDALRLSELQE